jgi:hypothetical protein
MGQGRKRTPAKRVAALLECAFVARQSKTPVGILSFPAHRRRSKPVRNAAWSHLENTPWLDRKMREIKLWNLAAGLILITALAGCKRDEARVYHIPKEASPPPQSAPEATPEAVQPEMDPSSVATMSAPQLKYRLPEGWQEKPPSEMRVASFTVPGPAGQSADVSAIPLPIVGRDLELVNMWRSQVQLPATSDPDAVKQAEPIVIGTEQGRLFDFVSEQPMIGKSRQRNLIAMLTRGTMSWFFKMSGEDAFVMMQKTKFLQFLKSVSFSEDSPAQTTAAPATQGGNADSIWTVPSGWQPVPPAQFLLAEFVISAPSGAQAEVNVAAMDGDGGGLLANVNRWRGQLGLGTLGESDLRLPQFTKSVDVPGGKATLVDFAGVDAKTGAQARLVGVIVSQNSQTWFYKMMGNQQIVFEQEDAFFKFIVSANYAHAR